MLKVDVAFRQINKHGEEICGDRVEIQERSGLKYVVMSDGLGSGVKANILASLTTKIIATMLREGCSLQEVTETLNQTLPVCRVRDIAYSTFTALKIDDQGGVEAAEYDNPKMMWFSRGELKTIPRREVRYGERMVVSESAFTLEQGDVVVAISDGVVHAGIGRNWNLGWSWERVAKYLETVVGKELTAASLSENLLDVVNKLYGQEPGDDTTVLVVQYRLPHRVTMMIGPPADEHADDMVVATLLKSEGVRIVCGGTTSNIVARRLEKEVEVLIHTGTKDVPAIGRLPGIDLVTEGVLTLSAVVDMLRRKVDPKTVRYAGDGASLILRQIHGADELHILLGKAINPAHQNPETPTHLGIKFHLIEELEYVTREMGKTVRVDRF
jgi:hypothetical protein